MKKPRRRKPKTAPPRVAQLLLPIAFFGLGGLTFCLLGGVYAWQTYTEFDDDEFGFAISSTYGTAWHRGFSTHDHPVLFAVRLLMDATGAVGALGLGLFLFGALISTSTVESGPFSKRIEAIARPWFTTSIITFGAHFVLVLVPYTLAFIDIL